MGVSNKSIKFISSKTKVELIDYAIKTISEKCTTNVLFKIVNLVKHYFKRKRKEKTQSLEHVRFLHGRNQFSNWEARITFIQESRPSSP